MNNDWRSLDNAAKIFPSAQDGADTQVFRFSCELFEKIDAQNLQRAVLEALDIFDVFHVVLKRGLFWYYLEKTDIKPVVREEHRQPCAPIYKGSRDNLLFSVTYYNCRINLEIYHVLSDGTGAMNFLNTIVGLYLKLTYNENDALPEYDASRAQMRDDSFYRYYFKNKSNREKSIPAYNLRGSILSESRMNIIIGHMKVSEVLEASHRYKTTMTEFLSACLIEQIGMSMTSRAKKKSVVLAIPVNLRKFFPSESASNFFSLIFTDYSFNRDNNDFQSIINKIKADFERKLNKEKLLENINAYSAIEHNIFAKIIPLGIKDFVLRCAYKMSKKQSTATFSNIGKVKMPQGLHKYIKSYDVYNGTGKLQVCMCSFNDTLSLSFTTSIADTEIQRLFFRKLASFGIKCELFTNIQGDDENEGM